MRLVNPVPLPWSVHVARAGCEALGWRDPWLLGHRKRAALGHGYGVPRRRMPHPQGQRARQFRNHKTHGEQQVTGGTRHPAKTVCASNAKWRPGTTPSSPPCSPDDFHSPDSPGKRPVSQCCEATTADRGTAADRTAGDDPAWAWPPQKNEIQINSHCAC